jgi:hypothetical protein
MRAGLTRRAVAGAIAAGVAWWVTGAIPAFQGWRACASPVERSLPPGTVSSLPLEFGETRPACAPSPWLPVWPEGTPTPPGP